MKKLIQIIVLSSMFSLCSSFLYAQNAFTFYVCSKTEFDLSAATGSTYDSYAWKEIVSGAPVAIGTNAATLSLTAPEITGAAFVTKQYTLSVFKGAEGCYSDPVTYTVHVLPKPVVSLNAPAAQCSEVPVSIELLATVTPMTLPAGVTASTFAWKNNAGAVANNTTSSLTFTSGTTDTYEVNVTYAFAGAAESNGGTKVDICFGTATTTITVNPKPSTPTVTLQ